MAPKKCHNFLAVPPAVSDRSQLLVTEIVTDQHLLKQNVLWGVLLILPSPHQSVYFTSNLQHLAESKYGVNLPQSSSGMLQAVPPPRARKSHSSFTHTNMLKCVCWLHCFRTVVTWILHLHRARPHLTPQCLRPAARHRPADSVLRLCMFVGGLDNTRLHFSLGSLVNWSLKNTGQSHEPPSNSSELQSTQTLYWHVKKCWLTTLLVSYRNQMTCCRE